MDQSFNWITGDASWSGKELELVRRNAVLQLVPRRADRAGEAHARPRGPPFAIEDRHDAAAVRGLDRARILRVAANHLLTRPVEQEIRLTFRNLQLEAHCG